MTFLNDANDMANHEKDIESHTTSVDNAGVISQQKKRFRLPKYSSPMTQIVLVGFILFLNPGYVSIGLSART